jgi:hypothetical protein
VLKGLIFCSSCLVLRKEKNFQKQKINILEFMPFGFVSIFWLVNAEGGLATPFIHANEGVSNADRAKTGDIRSPIDESARNCQMLRRNDHPDHEANTVEASHLRLHQRVS